jgi:resolvase-like protein
MRAALYLRVSTMNGQATDNQRLELQAAAERHGWRIVQVYADEGISGAEGREKAATGNYISMPFNRSNLGSEQGLIDEPSAWPGP